MGNVVPTTRDELIAFYKQHQPVWASMPESVGLTSGQVLELANRLNVTDFALTEAIDARTVSRTKTQTLDTAVTDLRSYGSSLMSMIRGFAESTGDPAAVFAKAQIPPPAKPTPAGPPLPPSELAADPNATGTITLRWKGTLASGQVFRIERSVDGGAWVSRGTYNIKTWLDDAVPMNSNVIQYRVFGQRGLVSSTTAPVAIVNFGTLPAALAAAFKTPATEAA
jgi:hypothetical protein